MSLRNSFLFIVTLILWAPMLKAEEPTFVWEDEYVIRVKEETCPWGSPCVSPLRPGVYLFKGQYLTTKREARMGRRLAFHNVTGERDVCKRFKKGEVSCSANFFVKHQATDPIRQWHHESLHTREAHKILGRTTPAAKNVTIAVLDTGVDCRSHSDLECLDGYDAISGALDGQADGNGHGTHVAGIIAATIGNDIGVAGVVSSKILPVRVLGNSGGGSIFSVAKGIDWAVENGATLINMSLGSSGNSPVLESAVRDAQRKGVIIIAAAGNDNKNNDRQPQYPANYDSVISVGATDAKGERAYFSNYGETVRVWAPGVDIMSTWKGGGYRSLSGTSMATPLVTGAIALTGTIPPKGHLDLRRGVGAEPCCRRLKFRRCSQRVCPSKGGGAKAIKKCREECRVKFNC